MDDLKQCKYGSSFACCSSTYLDINGIVYAIEFTYPHLICKILVSSNADLHKKPFSRNLIPGLDEDLLY
jgi:hypothetical protein